MSGIQERDHEVTPPERVAGWQDTKKIFDFSSLSRTFVTFAPEAHEPLAQCLA